MISASKFLLGLSWACVLASVQAQTIQAVTEDAPPYTYAEQGKVTGPVTEIVEQSLQRAGFKDYRLHLYPWARAYSLAQKQPHVLIFLIARTPAREALFHWAGEIMKIEYHLYRWRGRAVEVPHLDAARAYSIGVMRDDVRQQYLQSKGFNKLVVSAQPLDNFRKLVSGQVDLVPLTAREVQPLCKEAAVDCTQLERVLTLHEASTGLYMAYSRQTPPEVVERTRKAFAQLQAEGTVKRLLSKLP
ncbi:MAG: transporter substrate-binding domain-containing protein [Burkholderiales bacterium]|jgi:polar amino acid transport system substrate-binding protein|nr:transporter substrate-binding domain-containing protein [Burkholderiales bacterium]